MLLITKIPDPVDHNLGKKQKPADIEIVDLVDVE